MVARTPRACRISRISPVTFASPWPSNVKAISGVALLPRVKSSRGTLGIDGGPGAGDGGAGTGTFAGMTEGDGIAGSGVGSVARLSSGRPLAAPQAITRKARAVMAHRCRGLARAMGAHIQGRCPGRDRIARRRSSRRWTSAAHQRAWIRRRQRRRWGGPCGISSVVLSQAARDASSRSARMAQASQQYARNPARRTVAH
jgi:hypothetical protein